MEQFLDLPVLGIVPIMPGKHAAAERGQEVHLRPRSTVAEAYRTDRTALYFGLAAGRELRAVIGGEQSRAQALSRYHDFSAGHALPYRWMLRLQRLIPRVPPRVLGTSLRTIDRRRFIHWAFGRYLEVAHPRFVAEAARAPRSALTRTVRA